jgi:hypothetical protein
MSKWRRIATAAAVLGGGLFAGAGNGAVLLGGALLGATRRR